MSGKGTKSITRKGGRAYKTGKKTAEKEPPKTRARATTRASRASSKVSDDEQPTRKEPRKKLQKGRKSSSSQDTAPQDLENFFVTGASEVKNRNKRRAYVLEDENEESLCGATTNTERSRRRKIEDPFNQDTDDEEMEHNDELEAEAVEENEDEESKEPEESEGEEEEVEVRVDDADDLDARIGQVIHTTIGNDVQSFMRTKWVKGIRDSVNKTTKTKVEGLQSVVMPAIAANRGCVTNVYTAVGNVQAKLKEIDNDQGIVAGQLEKVKMEGRARGKHVCQRLGVITETINLIESRVNRVLQALQTANVPVGSYRDARSSSSSGSSRGGSGAGRGGTSRVNV